MGFSSYFEAKVASALSEFISRYDDQRDGFWTVLENEQVEGSLSLDGIEAETKGAHLRWFIVADRLQGRGVGRRLVNLALDFCREKEYHSIYLWTFEGLLTARHLYDEAGFQVVEERLGTEWGKPVKEQRLVLKISP